MMERVGRSEFIRFTVLGKPMGQPRARMTTISGHARQYDPKAAVDYKSWVRNCCMQALAAEGIDAARQLPEYGMDIRISCVFDIPKSFTKKQRLAIDQGVLRPTVKPDADNAAKIVMDALNGILYRDDKDVVSLSVVKRYASKDEVAHVAIEAVWCEERKEEKTC